MAIDVDAAQRLPAVRADPAAIAQYRVGLADVTEDGPRGCQPALRAVAGTDRAFDGLQLCEFAALSPGTLLAPVISQRAIDVARSCNEWNPATKSRPSARSM